MSNNAKRVLFRKGTTADHQLFTGARGEVTVDITRNIAIVHNGITTGGHELVGVAATGQSIVNKDAIGIGTPVADSALTVEGDVRISGIITSNILDANNILVSNLNVGILTSNNTISLYTSIIPDSNESYDLGSSTNKFRDLYLSGNTLKLGDASLSASSETLSLSGVGFGVSQFNAERLHVSGISTLAGNVSFGSSALFGDNNKILLGAGNDFKIYHDPDDARLENTNGDIKFKNTGSYFFFDEDGGETLASFINDGAVNLYHDNSKKFETTGVGVTIFGTTQTQQLNVSGDSVLGALSSGVSTTSSLNVTGTSLFQGNVDLNDNIQLRLGTGNDLQLYHESNNSYINNIVGNLYIRDNGGSIFIQPQSGENSAVFNGNTSVDLYYNGVKKFETTSTGIDVTGHTETDTLNVSGVSTFNNDVRLLDGDNLYFGTDNDTSIVHNGTNTIMNVDGNYFFQGNTFYVQNQAGTKNYIRAYPISTGAVELYHDNSKKLETTSSGVTVTGVIDADEFVGNGSGLTSVDASNLGGDPKTSFMYRNANSDLVMNNQRLHLGASNTNSRIYWSGTTSHWDLVSGDLKFRDNLTTRFTFARTTGNFTATGDVTAFSDITLKKNIELIPNALDKVLSLRGVTYNRIDIENEPKQSGVIAQEVEKVLPEVVHTNDDGIKSVSYGNMVGLLIEAIKDLKEEVETLKDEIKNLKNA